MRLGKTVPQTVVKNFDSVRYPHAQWKHLCIEGSLMIVLYLSSAMQLEHVSVVIDNSVPQRLFVYPVFTQWDVGLLY